MSEVHEAKKKQLMMEIEAIRKNNNESEQMLAEQETMIKHLKMENEEMKSTLDDMHAEIRNGQEEICSLQKEIEQVSYQLSLNKNSGK